MENKNLANKSEAETSINKLEENIKTVNLELVELGNTKTKVECELKQLMTKLDEMSRAVQPGDDSPTPLVTTAASPCAPHRDSTTAEEGATLPILIHL